MIYRYGSNTAGTAGTLRELGVDSSYYPSYQHDKIRMHGLDVVLLSCVLSGRGMHYLGAEVYPEDGTSVSIINYGQQHDIVTEGPMEVMNLLIDPARHPLPPLPDQLSSLLPRLISLHPRLVNTSNRLVRIPVSAPEMIRDTLMLIHRELRSGRAGGLESVRHLFTSFLIQICREASENGIVATAGDPRIDRVRALIDRRFAEPLRLSELADCAGLGRNSLCRRFRNQTGRTVFEYLLDRRLEAALARLRTTNDTVSKVALESGFADLAHFYRKFRLRFDTTPGRYRATMQAVSTA